MTAPDYMPRKPLPPVEPPPTKFAVGIDSNVAKRIRAKWAEMQLPGKQKRSFVPTGLAARDINDLLEVIVEYERELGER